MERRLLFTVEKELSSQRLDKTVVSLCNKRGINLSRSGIKSKGIKILVNGREERLSYITRENDRIEFEIPEPEKPYIVAQKIDFDVVYSDEHLAVINKPAGLTVHIGAGHYENTLVNGLLYRFKERLSSIGGVERPGIVHRLDKDTAGIMLVALSEIAHQRLSLAFKNREIRKIYYAIVKGHPPAEGKIELPLGRSPSNRKKMAVREDGKVAITLYRTICYSKDVSLVEIELKTGRTHQIRVHFSHLGHPIIGDPIYSRNWKKYKLALISKKIGFFHPIKNEWMEFEVPFDDNFLRLFEEFGLKALA
ncbi:MAG: RluA family pseudouridine synthase [Brevinematia bacterium]